jgi:dTDP-4-dehydrorhamnose reductase
MRILLTGKTGQLGWELHRQLRQDFKVVALGREDVDFRDLKFLHTVLKRLPKPDLIVNAAAYTNIDGAEHEPFVAEAVNSEAAVMLAEKADDWNIPMIHFSTDHVFSGWRRTQAYQEKDRPHPVSLYGSTKLDGELRIRNTLEKHLIFRLSGLYGIRRKNFFTAILARNRHGIVSRVVDDQTISPNWTPLVAEAVVEAIYQLSWGESIPWGMYHLSGSGSTTPYKFARLICEHLNGIWGGMPMPLPISSRESRIAAKRPKYSVLDPIRFNGTFQCSLPHWQEQLRLFFGELNPNPTGQQTAAPF